MSRATIYLIINKQNGHKFVGNTTLAMNKEWAHHIDRSKRMSSEPLHKAFREYGTHNFMIKELDECNESDLIEKTNYWINKYSPEYNPEPIKEVIEIAKKAIEEYNPALREIAKTERPKRSKPEYFVSWNEQTRGNGKHFGIKIRGKNLETGICTDYESVRVASEQVTGNPNNNSNILLAARTGRTAYGHKWQLLEDKKRNKAVFGVNKKTEQIEVRYESMAAALRDFECTDKNGILKSLRNPGRYSWRGYLWFYG
jgi:group I intron endonuclease